MKKWMILLLISNFAQAVTLEKSLSQPDASLKKIIEVEKKSLKLYKDTNYFDKSRHYQVGNFVTKTKGHEKSLKHLETLLEKIKGTDEALKKQGTSFNTISTPKGHVTVYRLDGYVIGPGSKYFDDLSKEFDSLSALNWKQVDGYEISKDLKSVKVYEKEKVKETKEYTSEIYCKRDVCTYYGGGHLFK